MLNAMKESTGVPGVSVRGPDLVCGEGQSGVSRPGEKRRKSRGSEMDVQREQGECGPFRSLHKVRVVDAGAQGGVSVRCRWAEGKPDHSQDVVDHGKGFVSILSTTGRQ